MHSDVSTKQYSTCIAMYQLNDTVHIDALHNDVSSKQYNTYRCIAMYHLNNTVHIDVWRCII